MANGKLHAHNVIDLSAHLYTTSFTGTENPLSESGNWLNGGTDGLDWTDVSKTPGLAIGHQSASVVFTDATAVLQGVWAADQWGKVILHSTNQNAAYFEELEIRLHSAISAHVCTGYEVLCKVSPSNDAGAYFSIVRWNGPVGDFTVLYQVFGTQYALQDGDVLSAQIAGTTISGYRNGVLLGSATDSTFSSGAPGFGLNQGNGDGTGAGHNGDWGATFFQAGEGALP